LVNPRFRFRIQAKTHYCFLRTGVEAEVLQLLEGNSSLQDQPVSYRDIIITVEPIDNLRRLVDGDQENEWIKFKRPHWPIRFYIFW